MSNGKLSCYNRGCGKDFDPNDNPEDACQYHPGVPFFHDAYKGWTCCNKKSVDFTEFLNIKGCELTRHSNVKPPEPVKVEKPTEVDAVTTPDPPKIEPVKPSKLPRPNFNTSLVSIEPTVAPALKESLDNILPIIVKGETPISTEISIGTICKNGACGCAYGTVESQNPVCVHHPGVPIFHEGLKYWSCCNKRTADFSAFLSQKGCAEGKHKWAQNKEETESIKCRYDWHQTSTNIVIAIYAKMYHYEKSFVKVNPIRLAVCLVFPQQNDAEFNIDLELRGIIEVAQTKVQFYGTKVEVTLTKAEIGNWVKLDFPREVVKPVQEPEPSEEPDDDGIESDVDLDDIEAIRGVQITEQRNDDDDDDDEA